jgi:hypothetical protein
MTVARTQRKVSEQMNDHASCLYVAYSKLVRRKASRICPSVTVFPPRNLFCFLIV